MCPFLPDSSRYSATPKIVIHRENFQVAIVPLLRSHSTCGKDQLIYGGGGGDAGEAIEKIAEVILLLLDHSFEVSCFAIALYGVAMAL
jgi:hypothetical protein